VEIRGPEPLLEAVEMVQTEWIDISSISDTITINTKIILPDERIEALGETGITVSVKIKKEGKN
jgi:YbbR domain-containing protein